MGADASERQAEWSMRKLVGKIWPIAIFGALINVWNSMEISIFTPYLYSRVHCCGMNGQLPRRYDITAPSQIQAIQAEAKSLGWKEVPVQRGAWGGPIIAACSLPHFPPTSSMWSKSAHCASTSYVAERSQHLVGLSSPLQTVATIVILPVGGTVADKCGRRPVIMMYVAMVTLACIAYVLDTLLAHAWWGNVVVLLGGVLMCPCSDPKDTVIWGAISDIVGNRGPNLGRALSMQQGFVQAGWFFGFLFAFVTLGFHLESYIVPWIIFTCVAGSIIAFVRVAVPETLPEELRGNVDMSMFNPLKTQLDALLVMRQDKLLVLLMFTGTIAHMHFAGFITLKFSYLMRIGFSAQEAMLPSLTMSVSQIIFLFSMSKFGGAIGPMKLYVLGNIMFIFVYLFYGPLLTPVGHAAPYIAAVFLAIALGCIFPATAAIVSTRVKEADQAKCQAALAAVRKVGGAFGSIIWNLVIFDPTATGFAFIRPAFVSLLLSLATTATALYMQARQDSFTPVLKQKAIETVGERTSLVWRQI